MSSREGPLNHAKRLEEEFHIVGWPMREAYGAMPRNGWRPSHPAQSLELGSMEMDALEFGVCMPENGPKLSMNTVRVGSRTDVHRTLLNWFHSCQGWRACIPKVFVFCIFRCTEYFALTAHGVTPSVRPRALQSMVAPPRLPSRWHLFGTCHFPPLICLG